jgi:ADP-heptose:LPS heptosyltransferase
MLSKSFQDKIIYSFSVFLSQMINRGRDPQDLSFSNILCIRQDEIGDLCNSMHIFELLRSRYPEARITLWCQPYAVNLAIHDPNLDEVVSDQNQLTHNYDLIVDLRGKWKGLLYAIKHKPQYRAERGIVRLRNKRKGKHPHETNTNVEVIRDLLKAGTKIPLPKIYLSDADKKEADDFLQKHQLKKFAVLHPGARKELRMWPAEKYAAIACYLKDTFGMETVFIGDKYDQEAIEKLSAQIPFPVVSAAGILSLTGFAALAEKATIYIGNESGPLHIAALSGIPCIGLFGPGEPDVFYPVGKSTRVIHHVLSCNPCNQIDCVHPSNPCIQRITIHEVQQKIQELMNASND